MPSFDGNQKGQILNLISQFVDAGTELRDNCFDMVSDVDKMYFWDIGEITGTKKPDVSLEPFKPRNNQLFSDISFWMIFVEFDLKNQIDVATSIDIPQNIYQNLLSGLNQLLGWTTMVKNAYLKEDIPCYHNVQITFIGHDGNPIVSADDIPNKLIARRVSTIGSPTVNLTNQSFLCKVQTLLQGKRQVYFDISPCEEIVQNLISISNQILDILNNPTAEQSQPITPVEIDSTGTRKLIQTILDFQVNVTVTFKKTINLIEKVYGHVSFILLFLREDTKKDLSEIIDNLESIIGGNPEEIGITSLNQIKYVWLQGSDGNYYPVPPVLSTDLDNDIPLSRTNGILAGLKRADENARWRYQRINNILYEINTNNNINKAYLDDLSPRIQLTETNVNDIKTKQLQLEAKLISIETKIDQIITELNTP